MATAQKRKLWTYEAMAEAVECVNSGTKLREAARMYNVPVETLRRRVNGTVTLECRPGPPTILTADEETRLVQYLVDMADMGYGLSRESVMRMAYLMVEKLGRKHPFSGQSAGRSWFDGFKHRHPMLTFRTPQPLSYCRALCANPDTISDFFGKLGSLYGRLNVISKPMVLFNCDETSVSIVHKPGKVIAQLGRKNVYAITSAERGKTHTILSCVSASGYVLPPLMIYPRKRSVPDNLKTGAVPNTFFCNTENGWINSEIYMQWLKWFAQNIPPIRPVVLIQDGHGSHISIDVIEFAQKDNIHILCLPAHTTHILQPLDVGVFKSFKSNFSKACTRYIASHPGRVITSDVLASLVAEAWPSSFTQLNVMSGFRKCGLFPFNPSSVNDRQTAPSKVFKPQAKPISTNKQNPINVTAGEVSGEPSSPLFTEEQESLYLKRYEEGYDLNDPGFVAWMKINHPQVSVSVGSAPSVSTIASSSEKASPSVTSAPSNGATSSHSSDILDEVLLLPHRETPKKKKKNAINSKAVCITNSEVLQELKEKERGKMEEKELACAKKREKEEKKREREEKKQMKRKAIELRKKEREEKRKLKEREKEEKARLRAAQGKGKMKAYDIVEDFSNMSLDDDDDDAVCPKCGLVYADDEEDNLWICCETCNQWFDLKCTNIRNKHRVPSIYICGECK
jgi:hypothetical protein